ncbi:MAG: hypothetical protein WCJ67_02305 [Thermoleophilia bacterium]
MRLTRRQALAGTAGAIAGAAGIYALVDGHADLPARPPATSPLPPEQHLLEGVQIMTDNGVEILVPPLHHEVVTATLATDDLGAARHGLESVLTELEARYPTTPAGLGITVAWGLPYFRRYVPTRWARLQPTDLRAQKPALLDAVRFSSDPEDTELEQNDVAVLLRSDSQQAIATAEKMLFDDLDVFTKTTIRRGFAGGGLPRRLARAAGVPGADLIPLDAELFFGFTSTLRENLGPSRIANLETLGLARIPQGYFTHGTHMHLSHIRENLEAWYVNTAYAERVQTMFRPGLEVPVGTLTLPQGSGGASTAADVRRGYRVHGAIGHSGALQTASRLSRRHVGPDGTVYPAGIAIPQRADFNTLDNPFHWSATDTGSAGPAAGVHFVIFNPTSDDFHRVRNAMDGVLSDGTTLPFNPRAEGQGINEYLRTTRRQNFLVPPRAHRSFPLSEIPA